MAEIIRLESVEHSALIEGLKGRHPDARHYDPRYLLRRRDVDVYRPNGRLLLALRTGRVSPTDLRLALRPLNRVAKTTNRRPVAAGSNKTFRNNVAGYLKGRPTCYAESDSRGWWAVQRLARTLDAVYREFPDEYQVTADAAREVPGLLVPDTSFTTVTANRDHTGLHRDSGNLPGGYGVMTAVRSRSFAGGLFVMPRFRVAVELHPGDVLVVDNREYHGNTLFESGWRVSAVAYFNTGNLPAGHPLR